MALDKSGFVGVQETPLGCERYKFQMVLKDHSVHRGLISCAVLDVPAPQRTTRRCAMLARIMQRFELRAACGAVFG